MRVTVNGRLRSSTYDIDIPILPATPDMQSSGAVFSSSTLPIEIREPIVTIQQQIRHDLRPAPILGPNTDSLGARADTTTASLILSHSERSLSPGRRPASQRRDRWYER
jgi:hypothetical protein